MDNKNKELRDSFLEYCLKHPEQRFWQALRNWAQEQNPDITHIWVSNGLDGEKTDTFYK